MPLTFREALDSCLAAVPRGRVATCGTVAAALGDVRAAQSVATWLVQHGDTVGAHRIVRADGRPVASRAQELLAEEGVLLRGGRVPPQRFETTLPATTLLRALRAQQRLLASRVSEVDDTSAPRTYGGVDVAYDGDRALGVAVSVDADSLHVIDVCERVVEVEFPYIPTYLAFREFPVIKTAFDGLREKPDLLFVDGHGRLHPAQFGLACHAGVELDIPTIGIAKHPLVGRAVPGERRTDGATPIEWEGVVRGFAWTPPGASRPFYVSVGHRISLPTALDSARRATRRRYPEPLLVADRLSKERKSKKNVERSASGRPLSRRPPAQGRQGV